MDHPLLSLPQHVLDTVFGQLRSPALANCSLVCQAWRDLPYEYLPKSLVVQAGPLIDGILDAGLHRCKNLHTICVASRNDPVWARLAAALAQQQLPSLRELHIKHSSHTDAAHLQQLREILQVQGPQCCLHLSLNDKASLQALLPLLPLRGLCSLELNVPYIADGALQLLLHAATVQIAAPSQSSSSTSMFHPKAPQPCGPPHTQQQGMLRVGLWVCCWGGCPGLQLSEALTVYNKLQQVPGCVFSTCESINITSAADLAALSQLQGLEALGINLVSDSSSKPTHSQQVLQDVQQSTHAAFNSQAHGLQAMPESAGDAGGDGSNSDEAAWPLSVLPSLSSSLKELNIRGFPSAGWHTSPPHQQQQQQHQHQHQHQHQQQQQPSAALQHHALSALTGLTKLSLMKDWSKAPLPVGPIAALTLLQELTLERQCPLHARELSCLSSLTGLRALSLLLAVTADELVQAVQEGTWHLQGPEGGMTHRQQQRQQQCCAAVVNKLGLLGVGDSTQAAGLHDDAAAGAAGVRSCCCSAGSLSCRNAGDAGSAAARVGCDVLLQQVLSCSASEGASNPVLLDWSWLRHLQQLETAWLQVPHLDLSCLPDSLLELDAQQPRDLTRVSITCDLGRGVHLPRVQRLVLPHLLLPSQQPAGEVGSSMLAAEVNGSAPGAGSYGDADDSDSDNGYDDASLSMVQQHYEAALMLCVVQGCPELKELELVQWQPPAVVICKAAHHLRSLKLLSLVAGDDFIEDCQQQVAGVRAQHGLKALDLQLQEPLVLSSYPWSSVLAVR